MCYWKSALPRLVTTCWRGWEWFKEGSWITEILFIYSESPFSLSLFVSSSQLAVAAFHDFVSDWMNCVNEVWLKEGTAEGANVGRKSEENEKRLDIKLRAIWILVKAAESAKCWFPLALREEKTGQNKVRDWDMRNMNVSFIWIHHHEADFSLKWIFCSTSSFPNFKCALVSQHGFSQLWKKKKAS